MKKSELREIIKEELKEGTWSVPNSKAEGKKYIKLVEKLKDEIYDVFGDDDVMDGLDNALARMKKMLGSIK